MQDAKIAHFLLGKLPLSSSYIAGAGNSIQFFGRSLVLLMTMSKVGSTKAVSLIFSRSMGLLAARLYC